MFVHCHTIDALRQRGTESLPFYERALGEACARAQPVFGQAWYGDLYRDVSRDPAWLSQSLIDNAAKEGEGARKLWELSGRCRDEGIAEAIRLHALDESRHARLYVAICEVVFPDALSPKLRVAAYALSPSFKADMHPERSADSLSDTGALDELTQMNIGEIRTRIHQLLMRPVIMAHCSPVARPRLQRMLDRLLLDETKHIEYTARLVERLGALQTTNAEALFTSRMAEFNDITLREVGNAHFVGE
jgi:hypothetical protein